MRVPILLGLLGFFVAAASACTVVSRCEIGPASARDDDRPRPWVRYAAASEGIGGGRHVVLIAGDEEYRSEEALPMLAKILAVHHGFRCTVLFSTNREDGTIDPREQTNIPGIEAVREADLLILFLRFRELPDDDMRHVVEYVESGKPVIGIRTSTHAFRYERAPDGRYSHWTWNDDAWEGGFGRQVLGETWVAHHGAHGSESTRGVVAPGAEGHPILRGVEDVWGPTDVYRVRGLPPDATVLLHGAVLAGMEPDSPPVVGEVNDPMMPVAWTRERVAEGGALQRVVCTTMGAATDLESAGLRRFFVNACAWAVGEEERIPAEGEVRPVGEYRPSPFGFGLERRGVRASEHELK